MRTLNLTYLALFILCTIFMVNCKNKQLLKSDNPPNIPPISGEVTNELPKVDDTSNHPYIVGYDLLGGLQVENIVDTLPPHSLSYPYKKSLPNSYTYDNKIYRTNRHFIFQFSHFVENVPEKIVNLQISGIRNKIFPVCYPDLEGNNRGSHFFGGGSISCFVENEHNILFPLHFSAASPELPPYPKFPKNPVDSSLARAEHLKNLEKHHDLTHSDENREIRKIMDRYKNDFNDAPFPFIKLNQKEGAEWSYDADSESSLYKFIQSKYKHQGIEILDTPFGKIPCEKITAVSTKFRAGAERTYDGHHLTSYFHPVYGFVRLEYNLTCGNINVDLLEIDDSKLAKK